MRTTIRLLTASAPFALIAAMALSSPAWADLNITAMGARSAAFGVSSVAAGNLARAGVSRELPFTTVSVRRTTTEYCILCYP